VSYKSRYQSFIFESYEFDKKTATATFHYSFDGQRTFHEKVQFAFSGDNYDSVVLTSALELAFWVSGVSYYKTFPTTSVTFKTSSPDPQQARFLTRVYSEGLSQYIFENKLHLDQLVIFTGAERSGQASHYDGNGTLVLQSGGKDSLLLASLLEEQSIVYQPWYISSSEHYPIVLDSLQYPVECAKRTIDRGALKKAASDGALNGHVPVTYIVLSFAIVQMVLENKNTVLAAIGVEGEEPHAYVDEMAVNHQWSKTWTAEQLFAAYVQQHISPDIMVGSPLRPFAELKIAELFSYHSWNRFGALFSSCNSANYQQGADNSTLQWCGICPKCANSYLLFAPFVSAEKLKGLFSGKDLFAQASLQDIFKGLLGIDNVMKPFECIGEIDELRLAYHMAQRKHGESIEKLSFEVPVSKFDYNKLQPAQSWAKKFVAPVYS